MKQFQSEKRFKYTVIFQTLILSNKIREINFDLHNLFFIIIHIISINGHMDQKYHASFIHKIICFTLMLFKPQNFVLCFWSEKEFSYTNIFPILILFRKIREIKFD